MEHEAFKAIFACQLLPQVECQVKVVNNSTKVYTVLTTYRNILTMWFTVLSCVIITPLT